MIFSEHCPDGKVCVSKCGAIDLQREKIEEVGEIFGADSVRGLHQVIEDARCGNTTHERFCCDEADAISNESGKFIL